ncbi:MAG: hypothetical protein KJS83_12025, partial [Xanthomonadaceae bacterium]|nr:hypothetical protein [Xanthomonadaceae bacterium]
QQQQLDEGMRNIVDLRLKNKLDKLWPKAAAMARGTTAPLPVGTTQQQSTAKQTPFPAGEGRG